MLGLHTYEPASKVAHQCARFTATCEHCLKSVSQCVLMIRIAQQLRHSHQFAAEALALVSVQRKHSPDWVSSENAFTNKSSGLIGRAAQTIAAQGTQECAHEALMSMSCRGTEHRSHIRFCVVWLLSGNQIYTHG